MGKSNNRLELSWVNKNKTKDIEPRVLIENKELSFNTGISLKSENMLIHGDNLLALKSLENEYRSKIKCIYIDPPYNTGNAFNVYDDNVEHSIWLSLMRDRLVSLRNLLREDGVIFIQINDDEAAYLKVLCDEIFGRNNYESTFYVKVRHENRILREDSKYQLCIEQVLCYRKTDNYKSPRRDKTRNGSLDYKWEVDIFGEMKQRIVIGGYEVEIYSPSSYSIKKVLDGDGKYKQYQIRGSLITQKGSASEFYELNLRNRREEDGLGALYKVIGMGINGDGLGYRYIMQPEKTQSKNGFYFQGLPLKSKKDNGLPYPNFYDLTNEFNNAGYEGSGYFNGGKKPEFWVDFLLSLGGMTKDDYVLDSFLGSGTTAAVALKKGYKFIGIELGNHAYELCKTRLDSIIKGEDEHGIAYDKSNIDGYEFYELAPTLIKTDIFGQHIINPEYNAEMLAAAVAIHEGYKYNPNSSCYWKQSSNESNSYLFVTTKHINKEVIDSILTEMKPDEYLVIVCKSFDSNSLLGVKNITIKKIPQSLLKNCEFGVDNYNLNIINPPVYEDEEEEYDND